ncbi:MAG TPA: hypothetical protein VL860_12225 [Planctomycetota bacterium]|nr:hypothetical protein [Planctomycetota bacterium]
MLVLLAGGCDAPVTPQTLTIRSLPSEAPATALQAYFPETAKSHVALTYLFDPNIGATDPALLLPPSPESRWILSYLGEPPPAAADPGAPLSLAIPASRRPPIRADLLSVELWLAHAESVYVSDYLSAGRAGAKLRSSPWVESFGLTSWKMNVPFAEPLAQPRLVNADGAFLPTGSMLDFALSSPLGTVTFFGVVNDNGQLVGLVRDGRVYLGADRRLTSPYGMLDGLVNATLPADVTHFNVSSSGGISGSAGPEQKETFNFGPVRVYRMSLAQAESLVEIDGVYRWPAGSAPPEQVPVSEMAGVLLQGRREQTLWTPSWFYRNLRSLGEARALVSSMLSRMDEALIRDQTAPGPVKVDVKTDTAPFEKIFRDWAIEQSGARRRPPLRFRHDKRMIQSRAYFAARKAPIRTDGDDILLDFPPSDADGRSPSDQTARLLADTAKYLRTRMNVVADNVAHLYEIVETVQVGAEKKPRQDRAPRRVSLDETTGAYEVQPLEKPFRTKVVPGNPNAIDPQGTVYYPNVSAGEEIAEYRNLESEYKFILKALAAVQPELILEDPPDLVLPPRPADWQD